jgi:hypothetical protein
MIERALWVRDRALISESGSPFNPLLLKLPFFMPFVPFMLFLFRLLESQTTSGARPARAD